MDVPFLPNAVQPVAPSLPEGLSQEQHDRFEARRQRVNGGDRGEELEPLIDTNKAIRETIGCCIPQLTYVLAVYIIVNRNVEGLTRLNQTYPDVVSKYVASA